jgi:hypothetical protein
MNFYQIFSVSHFFKKVGLVFENGQKINVQNRKPKRLFEKTRINPVLLA